MLTINQKDVLFREITAYIKKHRVQSMLDIGAGDGALAVRLAKQVQYYEAVESRGENVKKLRALGLAVHEDTFPVILHNTFNMALVSHAVPDAEAEYEPFFQSAWSMVKTGGILLVATFKGGRNGTMDLYNAWRGGAEIFDAHLFAALMKALETLGTVSMRRAVSAVVSENRNEIVELALEAINPAPNKKDRFRAFVAERMEKKKKGRKYMLEFEHVFLSVTK